MRMTISSKCWSVSPVFAVTLLNRLTGLPSSVKVAVLAPAVKVGAVLGSSKLTVATTSVATVSTPPFSVPPASVTWLRVKVIVRSK